MSRTTQIKLAVWAQALDSATEPWLGPKRLIRITPNKVKLKERVVQQVEYRATCRLSQVGVEIRQAKVSVCQMGFAGISSIERFDREQ